MQLLEKKMRPDELHFTQLCFIPVKLSILDTSTETKAEPACKLDVEIISHFLDNQEVFSKIGIKY